MAEHPIIDRVVPQLSLIRSEIAILQMMKTPYLSQKKTSQRELEDAPLSSVTYLFHLSPHAPVIYLFLYHTRLFPETQPLKLLLTINAIFFPSLATSHLSGMFKHHLFNKGSPHLQGMKANTEG